MRMSKTENMSARSGSSMYNECVHERIKCTFLREQKIIVKVKAKQSESQIEIRSFF